MPTTNKTAPAGKLYHDFQTPIGTMRIVGDDTQIDQVNLPKEASNPPDPVWRRCYDSLPAPIRLAKQQLQEYFAGARSTFDVPLALNPGTPFRRRVWRELQRIPYGETISYGELARRIGQPTASRAVGGANHHNPIAIIVPCHRVIGTDGTLVGYGGGLPTKERLLAHEQRHGANGRRPSATDDRATERATPRPSGRATAD